jgi:Ternary complex associated domain 9
MSLLDPEPAGFEVAAKNRVAQITASTNPVAAIAEAFAELSGSGLARSEVARRAARMAELLPGDVDLQAALADAVGAAAPEVRGAVVSVSPAAVRQAAYAAPADGSPSDPSATSVGSPPAVPTASGEEASEAEERLDWGTVLLLGGEDETAANVRFLTAHKLKPIRVANRENLGLLSDEHICGLVFHRGWWLHFDDGQELLADLRSRLAGSNLLYVKLDQVGLNDDTAVGLASLLDSADLQPAVLSVGTGSELTPVDLARLRGVASRLAGADAVEIGVEGLDAGRGRLLAAAVRAYANDLLLPGPFGDERLSVDPISSGSRASVLRLRSEAFQSLFIAKLDRLEALQKEFDRTRWATPPGQPFRGEPRLYSLGGQGVLIQSLLGDLATTGRQAPSLRERLRECASAERGREGTREADPDELCEGIDRAVAAIRAVNGAPGEHPGSEGWMGARPLHSFAERGIRWRIGTAPATFDPAAYADRVIATLDGCEVGAVVHGDLHADNVLLPGDRNPCLIDFAGAGAGHPCFDLVRLSSALAYEFLRPLGGEEELIGFLSRAHIDGADEDELRAEYGQLLVGTGPTVALRALTACRRAALAAFDDQEVGLTQYLAMVYLIAVQSLTIEGFQVAVVRSALAALAPRVAAL